MAIPTYTFDPTGTLSANKIENEQHIITAINWRDYHFIVPKVAPYFLNSLQISLTALDNSVRPLVEGVDYLPTHQFIAASRACASPIYGSISFINTSLAGVVKITYQTLGGIWAQDEAKIAEILADKLHNPRTTSWDVVTDQVVSFPVIDHEWDLDDMVGMTEVVGALTAIEDQLRQQGQQGLADHIADTNNPHATTKAQVGLSNVQNYGIATVLEAQTGTATDKYITPFLLKQALQGGVGGDLGTHIAATNNPHQTTAAQVGAYSTAEVDALLAGKLGTGQAAYDTDRFNGKTSAEYAAQVLTGTAANSMKLEGLTLAQVSAQILLGKAADSDKLNGKTEAQLTSAILAGTAADSTLAYGKTEAQLTTAILAGKAADSDKLNGKTEAALTAAILAGTAANATKAYGKTEAELTSSIAAAVSTSANYAGQQRHAFATGQGAGSYWTELGQLTFPDVADPLQRFADAQWMISGGEAGAATDSGLYLLKINTRGATGDKVRATLSNLGGVAPAGAQIGYTVENYDAGGGAVSTVRVWLKTNENRAGICVTELGRGQNSNLVTPVAQVSVAPAGITYIAEGTGGVATTAEVTAALDAMTSAFNTLAASLT